VLAAVGSSAGAWLGWSRDVPALPPVDSLAALVGEVAPGAEIWSSTAENPELSTARPGAGTALFAIGFTGGDYFGSGYDDVQVDAGEQAPAALDGMAQALADRGWDVSRHGDPTAGLDASREGLHLGAYVSDDLGEPVSVDSGSNLVTFHLERAEPAPVLPLSLAGVCAGALVARAWLRAARRLAGRRRAVALWAAVSGALVLLPLAVLTHLGFLWSLAGRGLPEPWGAVTAPLAALLAPVTLLAGAALAVGLLAVLPSGPRTRGPGER
jgi:hypothetical protein